MTRFLSLFVLVFTTCLGAQIHAQTPGQWIDMGEDNGVYIQYRDYHYQGLQTGVEFRARNTGSSPACGEVYVENGQNWLHLPVNNSSRVDLPANSGWRLLGGYKRTDITFHLDGSVSAFGTRGTAKTRFTSGPCNGSSGSSGSSSVTNDDEFNPGPHHVIYVHNGCNRKIAYAIRALPHKGSTVTSSLKVLKRGEEVRWEINGKTVRVSGPSFFLTYEYKQGGRIRSVAPTPHVWTVGKSSSAKGFERGEKYFVEVPIVPESDGGKTIWDAHFLTLKCDLK